MTPQQPGTRSRQVLHPAHPRSRPGRQGAENGVAGSSRRVRTRRESGTVSPGGTHEHQRTAAGDDRAPRRAVARPDDERARRPDLPDDVVHVRRHRARGRPVRAEAARQHLHADHEPDLERARAAARRSSRARARRDAVRRARARVRPGGRHLLGAERLARGRQHRRGLDALRRHLQPVRAHAAAVRHRGALRRPGHARRTSRATSTTRRGSCSPRRSATRA